MHDSALGNAALRKVFWRVAPYLCLLYIFNILDRANVGFARLQMQDDLGLSEQAFDLGYGAFYIGYLLFEVPSNLLLRRMGARKWIARIMITWGLVSCGTMFAQDASTFYALRILLGLAEAGFFPGIILYLSYWFPDRQRAKVTAYFMLAIGLARVFGDPISGLIMHYLDGYAGLAGWQWLFLLEGLPTVFLGFSVLFCLTDYPSEASWLSQAEREWLVERMRFEEERRRRTHGADHLAAIWQWRVWLLIAIYFTIVAGANASGAYFPTIIKSRYAGYNTVQIGFLSALPHVCSVAGMTLWSISSDRLRERRWHLAAAGLVAAAGWALAQTSPTPAWALIGLCLAQTGMMCMLPVFWTLPTSFLTGAAAAGGIALISSLGNIGGFLGPSILGNWGPFSMAGLLLAGVLLVGAVRARHLQV